MAHRPDKAAASAQEGNSVDLDCAMLRARLLDAAKTKLRDPDERACRDGLIPPKTPSIVSDSTEGDRPESGTFRVGSYSWGLDISGLNPMAVGNRSEVWRIEPTL